MENEKPISDVEQSESVAENEGRFRRLYEALKRNYNVIIAVTTVGTFLTTVAFAVLSTFSLLEVREQRLLQFRQFAIANLPSVRLYTEKGFSFAGEKAILKWKVTNRGGTVFDGKYATRVMCGNPEKINDPIHRQSFEKKGIFQRLNRDEEKDIAITCTDKEIVGCLKEASSDNNAKVIYVYNVVEFIIPAALSLDQKDTPDKIETLEQWRQDFGFFGDVPAESIDYFLTLLKPTPLPLRAR